LSSRPRINGPAMSKCGWRMRSGSSTVNKEAPGRVGTVRGDTPRL
jgi:hypothetical protein